MFETFNVPCFYLSINGLLALYSCGRTTGVSLECGEGITNCLPVEDGSQIPYSIKRMNFAGSDIDEYLRKILNHKGYNFS